LNVVLEPLEIPLIKASGEDPKKVKVQLEWWLALLTGKSWLFILGTPKYGLK
jgi:hypothetical protein